MDVRLPALPATTTELIAQLRDAIRYQSALETEADLPDVQCAMVSLLYAEQAIARIPDFLEPADYLRRYVQLLENRYSRIQAEDAGEYGSGRDALGAIIEAGNRLLVDHPIAV